MKRWKWYLIWLIIWMAWPTVSLWADGSGLDADAAHADVGRPSADASLPYRYAWAGREDVPVYAEPGDPTQMTPLRHLVAYYTWVSIKDEIQTDRHVWYRIDEQEYVLANDVWVGSPSTFHGLALPQEHRLPFGFVVNDDLNVRAEPGVSAGNPPLATLPLYTVVDILGQETVDGEVWYQIDSEVPGTSKRYVHSDYVRVVTATARPEGVAPDDKWIAVNLAEQTLVAYEGERMVFATAVSTGLPWWQTPEGLFRIWTKVRSGDMSGGGPEAGYYYLVQDVPWTMYFQGPYALHAAYWHDDFGHPHSRGCVNLSPRDARWLFEWTLPSISAGRQEMFSSEDNPGTWVYVHSTPAVLALEESEG